MPPNDAEVSGIQGLYRRRFDQAECERRNALWKVRCEQFLQRYVDPFEMTVYRVTEERPRFLPYTTKTSLLNKWLLRVYLWLRPLQWPLGRRMFVVAQRED